MIPIARPVLGDEESNAISRVLRSGWITQGPEVAAFEQEFARYVGGVHACAVSSCTAALHLALLAVGASPGKEVITASSSFIATANAIRYTGALPVFVDVELETGNMDPLLVEAAVGPRTSAILVVHQLGMPCDLKRMLAIAQRARVPLIEDAACAVGSEIDAGDGFERIGKPHGLMACFSFHPRKLLSTGDGGMIVTRDAAIDAALRRLRQHGMTVNDRERHAAKRPVFEQYPVLGYNYRLTDIQAAVGREQLARLDKIVPERRKLAADYRDRIGHLVQCPAEPEWARSNWQSYSVLLAPGVDQKTVMQSMLDAGVATRRGVMSTHREEAYSKGTWRCASSSCNCAAGTCRSLPNSEAIQDRGLMLPLFSGMSAEELDQVAKALAAALSH